MDQNRVFGLPALIFIGALSGVAVSLVKLIQAGFYLGEVPDVEFRAALLTYGAYMALGAFGAVFLVDHDAKGQKMLKNAFLMGFVAPSFFLALLNHPVSASGDHLRDMLRRVPQISEFFLSSAHAQGQKAESSPTGAGIKLGTLGVRVLEKKEVELSLSKAVWRALGWQIVPTSYAYIVGTTEDQGKALATAHNMNKILREYKAEASAKVLQPKGRPEYYVAIGDIGSPEQATIMGRFAKDAAIYGLWAIKGIERVEVQESQRAAALMLKGEVVDARAMFAVRDD